jgi:hypothetical protein
MWATGGPSRVMLGGVLVMLEELKVQTAGGPVECQQRLVFRRPESCLVASYLHVLAMGPCTDRLDCHASESR